MIVDYKKVNSDEKDLLWVIDQLPGKVKSQDFTQRLKNESYFPSYNIPVFPEIFKAGGSEAKLAEYGDWGDYHKSPRAKIFAREHTNVHNMADMQRLMRWNKFMLNDTLTACNCTP